MSYVLLGAIFLLGLFVLPKILRSTPASDAVADARYVRRLAIGALVLITLVYFYTSTRSTLWDLDDALNGQVMAEMLASGNTRVPTIDGQPRLKKPPLVYWLAQYPLRVFGKTAWASRLVSTLSVAVACWMTFLWGARYLTPRAGLLGMLMLSVAPLMILSGSGCTMDALLLALMTLAIYWLTDALHRGFTVLTVLGLGGVLGLAMLTKGPLGYCVPMLAFGVAWLLSRAQWHPRTWFGDMLRLAPPLILITILACGVFLIWLIPANAETGGALVRVFIMEEHLGRIVKAKEGHGAANPLMLLFYLPIAMVGFFPFTAYVPGAISALLGKRIATPQTRAMLVGWTVPTLLVMSLVKTKLPHYILPVVPGLALLTGTTLVAQARGLLSARDTRWLMQGKWLLIGLGIAIVALLVAIPILAHWYAPGLGGAVWWGLGAAFVASVMWLALRWHGRAGYARTAALLWAGMLAIILSGGWLLMPHVEEIKFSHKMGRYIAETVPSWVPMARYVYHEPSLSFYSERYRWEDFREKDAADLLRWLSGPAPRAVVMERYRFEALREKYPLEVRMLDLQEVHAETGFYYNRRGRWTDLILLRTPPPTIR